MAEAVKKFCPLCGQPLVVRTNENVGIDFLGCSQYPECHHTEPLPIDIEMRRQGMPGFPGCPGFPE